MTCPIYRLLALGPARTRREIADLCGLSRATTAERLHRLQQAGLVHEGAQAAPEGGRPARLWQINATHRSLLALDLTEGRARIGRYDLDLTLRERRDLPLPPAPDAAPLLDLLCPAIAALCQDAPPVAGMALARDEAAQEALPGLLRARLGLPVTSDRAVALMALAEHRQHWPDRRHLVFVAAGTGLGCAILSDGRLLRGAGDAAGGIAHLRHGAAPHPPCPCGRSGCLEARASGWAMARDLRAAGVPCPDTPALLALCDSGDAQALRRVAQGARLLGTACADLVAVLNPQTLVIGGALAGLGDVLLREIRAALYRRCPPQITAGLDIRTARGTDLALTGAAHLARDAWLTPDSTKA
ncbi:MAG TPA: hypothetical protein DD444_06005 [Citreicella sp.]|jgi:glucokinase|nr:hypothetical protein [Citreicella sp.]